MLTKTLLKLFLFRSSYIFSYIAFIGLSLFIHFFIGHEIPIIENWLYHYSGWILILVSLFRIFLIFLSIEENFKTSRIIRDVKNQLFSIRIEQLLVVLVLGLFFPIYFSQVLKGELITRVIIISRPIVLFFVILVDIVGTDIFLKKKKGIEFLKYCFIDGVFAFSGVLFFHKNLHLSLVFAAFYFGAFCLYLLSRNVILSFVYFIFVLIPISSKAIFHVDIFSIDYVDIFSFFVVIIAHLIPYIWMMIINEGDFYGTKPIRYS